MYELIDKELGRIVVNHHKRAKRVIARRRGGYIQLTVPDRFNMKNIPSLLQELKPGIMKLGRPSPACITEEDVISTLTFDAHIVRDPYVEKRRLSLKNGNLHILFHHLPIFTAGKSREHQKGDHQCIKVGGQTRAPGENSIFCRKTGTHLQSGKDQQQQITLGKLLHQEKHQLLTLPDAAAGATDQLCGVA